MCLKRGDKSEVISRKNMLCNALGGEDSFITVYIDGKEYMIDYIRRRPDSFDESSTYVQLVCNSECGTGCLRR